nr:UDP-glucuronosyltransferase 1-2-like [Onthophagus taurus]
MRVKRFCALITILVLFEYISFAKCANILSMFPSPSKSHDVLGYALSKHLSTIGHNVTYISAYSHKSTETFHCIHLEEIIKIKENMQKYMNNNATVFNIIEQINSIIDIASMILNDSDIQDLIKSNSSFDVLIHFLGMDSSMILAHHFKIPIIVFSPITAINTHTRMVGNPSPPSYIPTVMTPYKEDMSFFQRVKNTVLPFVGFNLIEMAFNHVGNKAIQHHFPGYPSIEEIKDRVDLILVNSHLSTETPRPYVPNMIQIGGFHLQKPEPLKEDLKQILDDAKEGFVYFSLGTNVRVSDIPSDGLDVIKKCLGKLPFKIIFKFDEDEIADAPKNFYVRKWFPQPAVLSHPNIKLFISHGGYGGMTESLFYGIPVVCIPFFGDQQQNCVDAEHNGYSVTVNVQSLEEKSFSDYLEKVLYDKKFIQAIKFKSDLYRDQPMNPMDKAVYWIEHVIKHKGAKHLRVKGIDLPWYQYYLLDVFLFIGLVIIIVLSFVYYSLKYCCKYICYCSKKRKVKTN